MFQTFRNATPPVSITPVAITHSRRGRTEPQMQTIDTQTTLANVRANVARIRSEIAAPVLRGENFLLEDAKTSGFYLRVIGNGQAKWVLNPLEASRWTERGAKQAVKTEAHLNLKATLYIDALRDAEANSDETIALLEKLVAMGE